MDSSVNVIGFLTILSILVYNKFRSNQQTKTITASSHPCSLRSSSSRNQKYDVYPSFFGKHVGKSFISQIKKVFLNKGIVLFIEDEINRRDSINPELIEAIRVSRIVIVVLSRNYASSSCCLDELVEIIKCREELGQTVMVLFYEVDPTDVKKQTGDFGKVFKKTCKGKTEEVIRRWRQALVNVANIAGYHSEYWDSEGAMIESIANDILNKLNKGTPSREFYGLVGVEAHMEKMAPLLHLDSDEVRMIGIWGPPGIGKTTIARVIFNQLSNQFQLSVFMENIKVRYPILCNDDYSVKLQLERDLLSQLTNHEDTKISHLGIAQDRLKDKRVLVVLDDIDSFVQLEALAKETRWFGPGSRIIITTQDKMILNAHGISHIYEVDFPPPNKATTLSGQYPLEPRIKSSNFGRKLNDQENKLPKLKTTMDGDKNVVGCDMDARADEFIEDFSLELEKQTQESIIEYQDGKEDLCVSERALAGTFNGLLHAVYIYCADTLQHSFASQLSMDFRRKGISASVNYNGALDVIEGASASVVVFSKNYFSSTSCLDKLVSVLESRRKIGLVVVPVFYGISPSDVVVQEHESADRISEWNSALQELRELPGHLFREECSECELVEKVVKDVYEKIFPTEKIGINSRLLELEQLLCKQPWGIRHLGIWGMSGIGKTTLAKEFYNQISGGYEASCFISDFDKAFHEKGLQYLLEEHFRKFLKELPPVSNSITRLSLPREKLSKKIILVVLDDVHNPLVAESFLREVHWFGLGSLIIITSRDKQVFRHCQINHVYEIQGLNQNEALQLFSQCAFGKDIRAQNLMELSMEVIDYANGNPLALSFYGRELKGKTLLEMETTFLRLKQCTPNKVHDLFKSDYETLNDIEKNIFLDIACFFNGENIEYVMQLLEGCGFFPHVGIDVLVEKCLVTISENRVTMHRIIQDFGREIINRETIQIERRRRLWEPWTIKFLFEDDKLEEEEATSTCAMGTEDIEGIFLNATSLLFDMKPTAFEDMLNLRFLKIYYSNYENPHGLRLPKGLESLPYELRLLHWDYYPLQSLPRDFDPDHLIELSMSYSQLHRLWGGTKNLDKLKTVRLCHSQQLTEIDDVSKAHNIQIVDLQGCAKLQRFPATGQLQHLRVVNLSGCKEIKSFAEVSPNVEEIHLEETGIRELPLSIGNVTNLKKLYLTGCASLGTLPSSIGNASRLEVLDLSHCLSLMELPNSIGDAANLEKLNLEYCSSLVKLPSSIGNAANLKKLCLTGCSSLVELPSSIDNATNLLVELPSSLGNTTNSKNLSLTRYSRLKELPELPKNTTDLKKLPLTRVSSVQSLPESVTRQWPKYSCIEKKISEILSLCFEI